MRTADRFFVLDFDRCLGNTTALQSLLEEVVVRLTTITREQMQAAQAATEQSGGSFDTAGYVQEKLREQGEPARWDELARHFVTEGRRRDLLEPGARELLDMLREQDVPHGIVTYGGRLWQLAKLEATGLADVPYLITDTKEKGRMIAQWRHVDRFRIPTELAPDEPLAARALTLVDDKATSFDELPKEADGIYVLPPRGQVQLASQQGEVAANVTAVHGLEEAVEAVRATLTPLPIDKT